MSRLQRQRNRKSQDTVHCLTADPSLQRRVKCSNAVGMATQGHPGPQFAGQGPPVVRHAQAVNALLALRRCPSTGHRTHLQNGHIASGHSCLHHGPLHLQAGQHLHRPGCLPRDRGTVERVTRALCTTALVAGQCYADFHVPVEHGPLALLSRVSDWLFVWPFRWRPSSPSWLSRLSVHRHAALASQPLVQTFVLLLL